MWEPESWEPEPDTPTEKVFKLMESALSWDDDGNVHRLKDVAVARQAVEVAAALGQDPADFLWQWDWTEAPGELLRLQHDDPLIARRLSYWIVRWSYRMLEQYRGNQRRKIMPRWGTAIRDALDAERRLMLGQVQHSPADDEHAWQCRRKADDAPSPESCVLSACADMLSDSPFTTATEVVQHCYEFIAVTSERMYDLERTFKRDLKQQLITRGYDSHPESCNDSILRDVPPTARQKINLKR